MQSKITFPVLFLLLFTSLYSQDHFPGGVAGAEAWYIADYSETSLPAFTNHADPYNKFVACTDNSMTNYLFNFNHSVRASHLCISYTGSLEISTSRNIFFVGQPALSTTDYSHVTTSWRSGLTYTDTVANRFDAANQKVYINTKKLNFQSVSNANINFYNVNIYQREKRIKSYGISGETSFYIGKGFSSVSPQAEYFAGNFPEFISFPFELTANEKNRVDSYLALKYGITLAANTPYRNARNLVFWNPVNYIKFGSRIFGIGRDDISGLNQLESESVHNTDYLIGSVGDITTTNQIKQGQVSIDVNHFIVFGDNGQTDGLLAENAVHVRTLKKKWLSQNTGENTPLIPINFKLNLAGAINQAMTADPHLKLWMVRDKYVTNQAISAFTSQYVDYYKAFSMDGLLYGYFSKIFFDPDEAIYDQFTFGVGPEMIVQVRFELGDCDDNNIKSYVVITGGTAPYSINIKNTNNYDQTFATNDNIFPFTAVAPDTYTVSVTDASGNTGQVILNVAQQQVTVDLGADVVLNASLQQTVLNAGQTVLDPTATYQWYLNGVLLQQFGSTLTVTQPGEYSVVVTSGNMMCQDTDTIKVYYNFQGYSHPDTDCDDDFASITIGLTGGVPPYTAVFSGDSETVSQVFNTATFTATGLEFGSYAITVTDSSGNTFQSNVNVPSPPVPSVLQQLSEYCSEIPVTPENTPVYLCWNIISGQTIDASLNNTNLNVSYTWYMGSTNMNINGPVVTIVQDVLFSGNDVDASTTFSVVMENLDTGCTTEETFILERNYGPKDANGGPINFRTADPEENKQNGITAKVYPNPSPSNSEFYYELTSDQVIEGTVEVYSPEGKIIYSRKISGDSKYNLPFNLMTAGVYLITTRTNKTILTNKVIIR